MLRAAIQLFPAQTAPPGVPIGSLALGLAVHSACCLLPSMPASSSVCALLCHSRRPLCGCRPFRTGSDCNHSPQTPLVPGRTQRPVGRVPKSGHSRVLCRLAWQPVPLLWSQFLTDPDLCLHRRPTSDQCRWYYQHSLRRSPLQNPYTRPGPPALTWTGLPGEPGHLPRPTGVLPQGAGAECSALPT